MNITYIPMNISFDLNDGDNWVFMKIPSYVYLMDMILNFNTAYYKNGTYIYLIRLNT